MDYEYITEDSRVIPIITELMNEEAIGFDVETTGLNPRQKNTHLRLVQFATEKKVYVFDCFRLSQESLEELGGLIEAREPIKVGHNLKFDIKFAFRFLGVKTTGSIFDTMIAAEVLSKGNTHEGFKLSEVVERYLDESLRKDEQKSDWSVKYLSPSQLLYAAKDAHIVLRLREVLKSKLITEKLIHTIHIEHQSLPCYAMMEYNGVKLDMRKWKRLYDSKKKLRDEIKTDVKLQLAGEQMLLFEGGAIKINLNSPKQVMEACEAKGIKIPVYKQKKSTSANALNAAIDLHPILRELQEYRSYAKLCSSYGISWFEDVLPETGRIHGNYLQMRTISSRTAMTDPNLQNIPANNEYRNCFVSEKGSSLVWADYSQIELRILAFFSKDEKMLEAFHNGLDLHRFTASLVFHCPYEEVASEQRAFGKTLNFGIVYGISPAKISQSSGLSYDEVEELLDNYWRAYHGMKLWLDSQEFWVIKKRESWTVSGRKIRVHHIPDDFGSIGHAQRQGRNIPIQGSGAELLKKALHLLYMSICGKTYIKLIHVVHDEILLETADERLEEAKQLVSDCMIKAGEILFKGFPIKVDIHSGKCWSK